MCEMVGADLLKQALAIYHATPEQPATAEGAAADADRLENAIEHVSGKDLHWFFQDWVDHDPGLPDLSIERVTPRPLSTQGGPPSARGGWLVAVQVRNNGEATADVPVTVRSGTLTRTERLRIGPHRSETTRMVFEGTPEQVTVNDGSVPELRTSLHTTTIKTRTEQ
jgi:aminopeptidase N